MAGQLGKQLRRPDDFDSFTWILSKTGFCEIKEFGRADFVDQIVCTMADRISRPDNDKSNNPLVCVASAPGSGKSHALIVLAKRRHAQDLKLAPKNPKFKEASLFYETCVPITVTFNSSMPFKACEPENHFEWRILYSYFFPDGSLIWQDFFSWFQNRNLDILEDTSISCIQKYMGTERPILLLVDEVAKIESKTKIDGIISQAGKFQDRYNGGNLATMVHFVFTSLQPIHFQKSVQTRSNRKLNWAPLKPLGTDEPQYVPIDNFDQLTTTQRLAYAACGGHPMTIVEWKVVIQKHSNVQSFHELLGLIKPRSFPIMTLTDDECIAIMKAVVSGKKFFLNQRFGRYTVADLIESGILTQETTERSSTVLQTSPHILFEFAGQFQNHSDPFCRALQSVITSISPLPHAFESFVANWHRVQLTLLPPQQKISLDEFYSRENTELLMTSKTRQIAESLFLLSECVFGMPLPVNTNRAAHANLNNDVNTDSTLVLSCVHNQPGFDLVVAANHSDHRVPRKSFVFGVECKLSSVDALNPLTLSDIKHKLKLASKFLTKVLLITDFIETVFRSAAHEKVEIGPLVVLSLRDLGPRIANNLPDKVIVMGKPALDAWFTRTMCQLATTMLQVRLRENNKNPLGSVAVVSGGKAFSSTSAVRFRFGAAGSNLCGRSKASHRVVCSSNAVCTIRATQICRRLLCCLLC
eukprot:c13163_g1_i5.p1 GENE.c13163_g1_i5~~c13163_g1_i5.p1  ORF type:complete len:698 (-),score=87.77 c13163_g1_i5:39-2132(-)